jgi:hypothetical protein
MDTLERLIGSIFTAPVGAGSKLRKYTIGPYGRVTLHQARVAAQKVFAAKLDGRDLAAEKQQARRRIVIDNALRQFNPRH